MNNKILTLLVAAISLIGVALFVNVVIIDKENVEAVSNAVSPLVSYSYYLLIVIVIVAVVISLLSMLKNPAALKKTLLGVLVLGVLLVVSYMLSSDSQVLGPDAGVLVAAGSTSKWVGTGISFTLILGAIAGAFFVVDLLKGIVKS
ncbi:hypothetical protein [Tenacibaculum piscium]|uniref:Uncharacterized protein n=2 Tax=Tenacibaculum piscium TaxID=1458515 RepID=A0A2H1YIB4_9FLAO|nr:hypothetical protein [Tenacibaculum piscium]MBE7629869.1 hypothetical protein [Tenacibaculum piscium]MBE7670281.1 hypothetical protein [Tenacibaculum piscium]MBE7685827.1 hypothetical protein [Tenacibaculum piscium]MBE7690433.1 hypothetical protein [Tenacibaculum piscium]MCG8183848.1 hypothetical protein [Tenacibaculum piscium]